MSNVVVERFDPHDARLSDQTRNHHIARYKMAASIAGSRVLDLCCGQGYGSGLMKRLRPELDVLGVDVAPKVMIQARRQYPDCEFLLHDVTTEMKAGTFDTVVFFEAIEHFSLRDGHQILHDIVEQHLTPGGTLIMSTPENIRMEDNEYHVTPWPIDRLLCELNHCFADISVYGQSWETAEISKDLRDAAFYVLQCDGLRK
jgi:O-antigen biosynthesis protein